MNKLVLAIKLFNSKSALEKILIRITNEETSNPPKQKHIENLVNEFRDKTTGIENLKTFMEYLRQQKDCVAVLKLLIIAHIGITNVGNNFCQTFSINFIDRLQRLITDPENIKSYVLSVLISNYYNYLLHYCRTSQHIKECRDYNQSFITKAVDAGDQAVFQDFLALKVLLRLALKLKDSVHTAVTKFPDVILAKTVVPIS
jgi:hypothetical protein